MSILSIYAAYRLTRIVEWSVGKKPRRDSFKRFTAVDDEVLFFIARNLARRKGLRNVAIALLHASNVHQRKIARVLSVNQATVSRGLKVFFDAFYRFSGTSGFVDTDEE